MAEAAEAASAYDAVSLDRPDGDGRGHGRRPSRRSGFEDERFDLVEYGAILEPALRALPRRERLILRMRFDRDMTQGEIAQALGMSQMHVSRLLRRSLGSLRESRARAQRSRELALAPNRTRGACPPRRTILER